MQYYIANLIEGETGIFNPKLGWIPQDESNSDYQVYLAWCAEGNTPEPFEPA